MHKYITWIVLQKIYPCYVWEVSKEEADELLLHKLSLKLWRDIQMELSSRQLMKNLNWDSLGYSPTYKNRWILKSDRDIENKLIVARGAGGYGGRESKIQPSSYGMNKSGEWKVQHTEYSQWYCNLIVWWQRVATLQWA